MTSAPTASPLYRATIWIANHWLATFNSLVGIYVLLPFVAPMLLAGGFARPAAFLYRIYSPTCHQMAFRSIFIGGEQLVYPREHAHTLIEVDSFESYAQHLEQFHEVSLEGLGTDLMLAARHFTGSEQMGYKTAICQRDLMIFGFLLVGGIVYGLLRNRVRIRPMPLILFILIGMGPIALDGFSQLFSYYIPSLAFRESPPYLRLGTGALFGFCVAWLVLPYIDSNQSSVDSEQLPVNGEP